MKGKTLVSLLGAPLIWGTMLGGTAYAGTIYQGSDYSYSTDSNHKAVICDREADARTAYVKYEAGNFDQGRINDQDGSSGSCWENLNRVPTLIMEHKTCEDINNEPDACSRWHSHY